MDRRDFFIRMARYVLFVILAGVTLFLGRRVISGDSCSACPGKGICTGESDCSKYLQNQDGRAKR